MSEGWGTGRFGRGRRTEGNSGGRRRTCAPRRAPRSTWGSHLSLPTERCSARCVSSPSVKVGASNAKETSRRASRFRRSVERFATSWSKSCSSASPRGATLKPVNRKGKKAIRRRDFPLVTHRSAIPAERHLTPEVEWGRALSTPYEGIIAPDLTGPLVSILARRTVLGSAYAIRFPPKHHPKRPSPTRASDLDRKRKGIPRVSHTKRQVSK